MTPADFDEALCDLLLALGDDGAYTAPQPSRSRDEAIAVLRRIYATGYNDCAASFNLQVRIAPESELYRIAAEIRRDFGFDDQEKP